LLYINGKIEKGAKNLELDINAEKRAIPCFSATSSEFCCKQRIPGTALKPVWCGILLALLIYNRNGCLS